MPIDASGSMTDLSMHPQWLALIFLFFFFFFLLMQKSQNVRFIGRQILFGAFMAKDSWHGVILFNDNLSKYWTPPHPPPTHTHTHTHTHIHHIQLWVVCVCPLCWICYRVQAFLYQKSRLLSTRFLFKPFIIDSLKTNIQTHDYKIIYWL